MFIFAAILTAIVVAYMAQKGYLVRFYIFFNKIIRNFSKDKVDISSGRIIIWKYAIKIFKQNPVFGIGWENFSAKIPEYNIDTVKVHNNFIQLLCETGVIGFVLIALPMMMLLIRTYHYMRRYLYNEQSQSIIRIAYTTSFGIQFFFFVLDFIDPCIYKMNFWPIYTISIMSLIFARTYEKNTKFS
jgi:O-antigen ligase